VKLDYLKDGSDDCPFVRLYEFRSVEIQRLRASFARLADGAVHQAALGDITPVETMDGTQLTFTRAERDRGVVQTDAQSFDLVLTPAGWQRCSGLLEPFCEPSWGYQWLSDDVGHIRLLVSHDGDW
jgi:hypothetical protein